MRKIELTLNSNNPSPFVQPYIVLHFRGDASATEWYVDVNGQIDLYIENWTLIKQTQQALDLEMLGSLPRHFNWQSQATALFREMIR